LFVRLIKPLIWIRFGLVRFGAWGHTVFASEYYLSEREIQDSKTLDCFYFDSQPFPNEQWALMMRRHLRISPIFRYADKINRILQRGQLHHKRIKSTLPRDIEGYLARTKPHITFSAAEESKGRLFLNNIGMKPMSRFVCLIVRDSAYKGKYGNSSNRKDWSYHDYRDSDIDTYRSAAMALVEKGYWVFRMGKAVHNRFDVSHPQIIDYANSKFRSDFLDIWFTANSYFSISTSTGLDQVLVSFRRPVLVVNHLPVLDCWTGSSDFTEVFKILKWEKTGNYLSLRDQIKCGAINFDNKRDYERLGITIIDNTSTQIRNAVLAFERKLTSNCMQLGNSELQKKFWKIMEEHEEFSDYHGKYRATISDLFPEENHEWFLA